MPDNEKTIQHLEMVKEEIRTSKYDTWFSGTKKVRFMGYVDDALELLKEQEPVKPTVSVDTWICSKCGHTLEGQELIDDKENPQVLISEQYNYCPNCGRVVKWDDT